MPEHGLVNLLLWLFDGLGVLLLAHAMMVGLGRMEVPQERFWGSGARMSRLWFSLYFGVLGLSFAFTMHLIESERGNSQFLAFVAVPALLSAALIVGWVAMVWWALADRPALAQPGVVQVGQQGVPGVQQVEQGTDPR